MTTPALRLRALGVVCTFACGFTILSGRLIDLQLVKHQAYKSVSEEMHYATVPVVPMRGRILDRTGKTYAQTLPVNDIRIDGKLALEDTSLLADVCSVLGLDENGLRASLSPEKRYLLIASEVTQDKLEKLQSLKTKYLVYEKRLKRIYPHGQEGAHVVGFCNRLEKRVENSKGLYTTEEGMQGVERIFDKYLAGIPGERHVVKDAGQREIPAYRQVDRKPLDGLNVVLTLDQGVQHILESEANRLVQEFSPESLSIIAVKPSTGEILGLTNRPTYDPNLTHTRLPERLRNSAVMDIYEPGSIFKLVTLAAVLNERVAEPTTHVFCENGEFFYAEQVLKDSKPYGRLTVHEALAVSSNIAFAKLALQLRPDRLYRYMRLMGFGSKVQDDTQALEGEEPGLLRPTQYWSQVSITRIPIGYEVATTNLQMTMAIAALANQGKLMEPRFVESIRSQDGRVIKQFLPKVQRQVVRSEVCDEITRAMMEVVATGTGKAAAVPGLPIAGKTGTARKVVNGQYLDGAYCSSFIGYFPAEDPKILVSVVVDYPKGDHYYASQVAAPAFSRIASRLATHLDVGIHSTQVVSSRRQP